MEFLDLVKIGSSVKINVNLSKDRLTSKTLNAIKETSSFKVKDFRLTDGKGVGVIVELLNGQEEWFFENEIEILDENGKIIPRKDTIEKNNFFNYFLNNLKYEPKSKIKELINPINFFSWLIYSLKDIF
mgnify:CR=1 FL=1|tara:strand:- start:162 stop:548 length:387 start_codon:yes stop_codon:yes gene_type:complete